MAKKQPKNVTVNIPTIFMRKSVRCQMSTQGNRVDERIKVEGRKASIIGANVNILGIMVRRDANRTRKRVVKMRESNFILGPDLLPNCDLVDIIKGLCGCQAFCQAACQINSLMAVSALETEFPGILPNRSRGGGWLHSVSVTPHLRAKE